MREQSHVLAAHDFLLCCHALFPTSPSFTYIYIHHQQTSPIYSLDHFFNRFVIAM